MTQDPVTHAQDRTNTLLSPLVLILLLVLYGAGMMALPIYFFGLKVGLWLSAALFVGGASVMVVLSGANHVPKQAPQRSHRHPAIRVSSSPAQTWVRPRITPHQQ